MEKETDLYEKPYLQFGDSSQDSRIDVFGCATYFDPICRGMADAPELLRKSVERFLIGNVV